MRSTLLDRLEHIRQAIRDIHALLASKKIDIFEKERATRAASERYKEPRSSRPIEIAGARLAVDVYDRGGYDKYLPLRRAGDV